MFIESQLLPYPSGLSPLADESSLSPVSVAPTAFHFLLLTQQKRIHVANKLNGELVYDYDSQHLIRSVAGPPIAGAQGGAQGGGGSSGGIRMSYGVTGGKQGLSATEAPIAFAVDQFTGSVYMYTEGSVNQVHLNHNLLIIMIGIS